MQKVEEEKKSYVTEPITKDNEEAKVPAEQPLLPTVTTTPDFTAIPGTSA